MARQERTSDIIEQYSERAVFLAGGGFLCAGGAFLMLHYGGAALAGFAWVLVLGALALFGTAGYKIGRVRQVAAFRIGCPFCNEVVSLASAPGDQDVSCSGCHRMIPLREGKVVAVNQVRCGYCNGLNYYSDKTDALLCEECNHEIPIQHEEGYVAKKSVSKFAVVEDEALYELVLVDSGRDEEDLIVTLQHMLALNRNQVKDILEQTPVTLLQGITRMKAEMLKAQIGNHGGEAVARIYGETPTPV
ncbi:hypothetical protein EON77_03385 [bacterium]|nr:MAG: hypothetical protein EON77_03385 [bacterium]